MPSIETTQIILALSIVIVAAFTIFKLWRVAQSIRFAFSQDEFINGHLRYQLSLMLLALIVTWFAYLQNELSFSSFFSVGNFAATSSIASHLGLDFTSNWRTDALVLLFMLTAGTSVFVFMQIRGTQFQYSLLLPYLPWIVILALTNSLSEELIFRLAVVVPLYDIVKPAHIALLSAAIFGLAHFGGMPHGLIGMLMAAILGWFLAIAMMDSHGMGIAWILHMAQDVVIYLGMMIWHVKANSQQARAYFGG